jgi:hypothetical protein
MKKKILITVSALVIFAAIISGYMYYESSKEPDVSMFDVGVEGGEFSTEDNGLRLIIPAQAVEQVTDIIISADNANMQMGPNQASSLYTIAGLQKFSKPVTIQIKTTAPLAGETYAALGRSVYIQSMGEWTTGFEYLPCSIKDGMVEFVFKPAPIESSPGKVTWRSFFSPRIAYAADEPAVEEVAVEAVVITNQQSTLSSDNRFKLVASKGITPGERQQILDALEHSFQFYAQMGFNQSYDSWPLEISIKDFWSWDKNAAYWVKYPVLGGWIEINSAIMHGNNSNTDSLNEEISSSIIHEYFHFVQFLYKSKNEWFDEVTATWAEEYAMGRNETPNPGNYRTHGTMNFQILDGPINHSGRDARSHGYGSWSFVKFLVNTPVQGGKLVKVYENISKYKSEVELLNSIRPVKEWINEFYVTHLTPGGPVPGGIALISFRDPVSGTPDVTINLADSGQAAHPTQNLTIPGLGARAVLVKIDATNANDITDSTSLEVRSNNDAFTVNLLRISTNVFEVLGTGANAASTVKIATIAKDKWPEQILVLVTNTSEQTMTCNLDFSVKTAKEFEVWQLERRFQGENGLWLGGQVLLYRNQQGQYYKMEQDIRHINTPPDEYGLKIDGNRVTILDYISPESTIYDVYEGTFSSDRKSIAGIMVTRHKADNSLYNRLVYDFKMTLVEE